MNFGTYWVLKPNKLTKFRAPKIAKSQFQNFQIPQNWFHIKSEWQKNPEISTLWIWSSREKWFLPYFHIVPEYYIREAQREIVEETKAEYNPAAYGMNRAEEMTYSAERYPERSR